MYIYMYIYYIYFLFIIYNIIILLRAVLGTEPAAQQPAAHICSGRASRSGFPGKLFKKGFPEGFRKGFTKGSKQV